MPEAGRPAQQQPSERELRELAVRGETLRQQLGMLESQQAYLGDLLIETRRSLQALEHLVGAGTDDEMLIPLGGGAFVHGRISRPGKAVTALGAGVHAELATDQARDRMRARVESLESSASAVSRDVGRVSDELARISAMLESYYGGA